jgi:phage-related minor tail protein
MGDGSLTSAAELEKFTEQLKHTGVAGEDAKKTIEEISRSGFIKPGQSTADFAGLARDIAQYNGAGAAGTPAAAEGLLKAFGGGTEEALKFAESLHALGAQQISEIHYLDQHGQSAEARRRVYVALRETIPPFTGDLSEIQKAFLGVKTAWDEFTTSLAKSDFPSLVTSLIKTMLDNVREDIREIDELAHFVGRVKASITAPHSRPSIRTRPGGVLPLRWRVVSLAFGVSRPGSGASTSSTSLGL